MTGGIAVGAALHRQPATCLGVETTSAGAESPLDWCRWSIDHALWARPRNNPSLCLRAAAVVVPGLRECRTVVASGQTRPGFHDPGPKTTYLVGFGPGSWKRLAFMIKPAG